MMRETGAEQLMEICVTLVGIGMGNERLLTGEALQAVEQADAAVGAARPLKSIQKKCKCSYIEYQPEEILRLIKEHPEHRSWVVALSGDIGFYSGAKKLLALLQEENIRTDCLPGIASVVYLAARLGVSWEDAALRSIHGRSQNIVYVIDRHEKTFLLLDGKSGEDFCNTIRQYGFEDVTCCVGSRLSYPDERILVKKGSGIMPEDIGTLAAMLVWNPNPRKQAGEHLRDVDFIRSAGQVKVPMTKEEVRAVCMAKLGLERDSVFYDVGAGTGSISVEAALHSENIRVYAIEQRREACELIRQNRRRFRVPQIQIIHGRAPEVFGELEPPTHAFVGGSTGSLREIICCLKEKNPEVVLVGTAVSLETIEEVTAMVREGILKNPEIIQLGITRSRELGRYHMMMGENPVYVISERK